MTILIDSHCHLDYPALVKDRAGVLARARSAGVARMVNISTTREDCAAVQKTAEAEPDIFFSVGIHPHSVDEEGQSITTEELAALAAHPKAVGIGETGFDFFYDKAPRLVQEESFRIHIRAACASGLPLIIHTRDAEEDTLRVLRGEGLEEGKFTGVLHCFTSKRYLAEAVIGHGFFVSLSGILTFKNSEELRETARALPLDKLLIETDSPFLAPVPHRGKPCEPAYVAETARMLAEVKGISVEEVARATTENFFRLFTKVTPLSGVS